MVNNILTDIPGLKLGVGVSLIWIILAFLFLFWRQQAKKRLSKPGSGGSGDIVRINFANSDKPQYVDMSQPLIVKPKLVADALPIQFHVWETFGNTLVYPFGDNPETIGFSEGESDQDFGVITRESCERALKGRCSPCDLDVLFPPSNALNSVFEEIS